MPTRLGYFIGGIFMEKRKWEKVPSWMVEASKRVALKKLYSGARIDEVKASLSVLGCDGYLDGVLAVQDVYNRLRAERDALLIKASAAPDASTSYIYFLNSVDKTAEMNRLSVQAV